VFYLLQVNNNNQKKNFPSPGIAIDQSLHQGDPFFVCLFVSFSTVLHQRKNFKVKSSVITCTAQKEEANWFGLSILYCSPLVPLLSLPPPILKEFLTQYGQIKFF